MKLFSLHSILVIVAAIAFVGCTSSDTSHSDDLSQIIRTIFEEGWSEGNIDVFDKHIAETVQFNYRGTSQTVPREGLNGMVLNWRNGFPDLSMNIEELIVQDQMGAVRLTLSGTHQNEWNELEPTGRYAEMAVMMFMRFEDEVIVEVWESDDKEGFLDQLKTEI